MKLRDIPWWAWALGGYVLVDKFVSDTGKAAKSVRSVYDAGKEVGNAAVAAVRKLSQDGQQLYREWTEAYRTEAHAFTEPFRIVADEAASALAKVENGALSLAEWFGIYDPLEKLQQSDESEGQDDNEAPSEEEDQ